MSRSFFENILVLVADAFCKHNNLIVYNFYNSTFYKHRLAVFATADNHFPIL
ncbi:MAG: hypothetical protein K0S09_3131 [Sphingobacteriaceae bacterium]|nr:hypothetical protein [Sphingobacteriaceae bacterium]